MIAVDVSGYDHIPDGVKKEERGRRRKGWNLKHTVQV
jgi:hypothetical protein